MQPETDQQTSQVQDKCRLTLPCGLARVEGSANSDHTSQSRCPDDAAVNADIAEVIEEW
jgi:hypothetical protein